VRCVDRIEKKKKEGSVGPVRSYRQDQWRRRGRSIACLGAMPFSVLLDATYFRARKSLSLDSNLLELEPSLLLLLVQLANRARLKTKYYIVLLLHHYVINLFFYFMESIVGIV
jgi:hypothetical protein